MNVSLPLLTLMWLPLVAQSSSAPSGLVLDLDADRGVATETGGVVTKWTSQAGPATARDFVPRDEGRAVAGSGRPTLRLSVQELNGHASLVFLQQELVCFDEDAFDGLTTGNGCTWLAVVSLRQQRVGVKDVNSFFGNLRNGGKYEGVWGCVNDDNRLWWGARNGLTFGRFDGNNPQILGPKLEAGRFYLLAGRLGSGTGEVKAELYVGGAKPVAAGVFPVNPQANPSRMAVGQERDAIQHPGKESFDGELARLLIYGRPLDDAELGSVMMELGKTYGLGDK